MIQVNYMHIYMRIAHPHARVCVNRQVTSFARCAFVMNNASAEYLS